jgi:hypothetical protein
MAVPESDIDALFAATRPRAEAVAARYRRQRPLRLAAGAFGCLPTVAVAVAVFSQWANRFDQTVFYSAATALVAAGLVVGALLFRRFAYADAPIHDQADREIVLPLAERLLEGATVGHPPLTPDDWAPARLLPETTSHPGRGTRLTGRIAGLPAVLDEGAIVFTSADDDGSFAFAGWMVRVALPFGVSGHLRVRTPPVAGYADRERRAFTPLPALAARLGGTRAVESAPPGSSYAGVARPGDAAPEAVVTDRLLAVLSEDETLQLAVRGSDLWILVSRRKNAFEGAYGSSFDRDVWREAARAFDRVERIVGALVDGRG